jgi:hypothetical protein
VPPSFLFLYICFLLIKIEMLQTYLNSIINICMIKMLHCHILILVRSVILILSDVIIYFIMITYAVKFMSPSSLFFVFIKVRFIRSIFDSEKSRSYFKVCISSFCHIKDWIFFSICHFDFFLEKHSNIFIFPLMFIKHTVLFSFLLSY